MKLIDTIQESYADIKAETQLSSFPAQSEEIYIQLHNLYEKRTRDETYSIPFAELKHYNALEQEIRKENIQYTSEDILLFSIRGSVIQQKEDLGMFLSALINVHHEKTKHSNYLLNVCFYNALPDHIGFHTDGAQIKIIGDIGSDVGERMRRGRIIIQGEFETWSSKMEGGIIIQESPKVTYKKVYFPLGIEFPRDSFSFTTLDPECIPFLNGEKIRIKQYKKELLIKLKEDKVIILETKKIKKIL